VRRFTNWQQLQTPDVTPITTGPLSIDINGNLILAANTASGTYQ
jgi:hypothetical protein